MGKAFRIGKSSTPAHIFLPPPFITTTIVRMAAGAAIKHFIIPIVPGTVSDPAPCTVHYNIIRRRVVRAARPIGPGRKLPLPPYTTPKFPATSFGPV